MAKPPSTASSTSTTSIQTPSTTPQQPTSSHARRRSAPRYSSPQVKSSYGAPASESANLNPSPSQAAASAALRPTPSMYSDSTRGSIGGGGGASDESDGESRQGDSAAVRQARLKERKRNTTIGRNKINGSSLNNTSVNIATAIYQAEQARYGGATGGPSASSYPANRPSSSYITSTASTSRKETHVSPAAASSSRRGPLPPAPMTQIQAPSSRSPDDDSLLEEERARRRRERTKSPVLDAIAGAARALSPVSYLLKPRVAQGGPFPDEDHDEDGAGYQSFSSFRAADRRSPGVQPPQDSSFLSANSAADLSSSSYLALGADRSQDSQASDYGFDEEERLMAEMEAKKARVLGSGGELRKVSGGQANAGWFSGLAGFVGGTREDEPADVTPKKKKGERRAAAADDDDGQPYEPSQNGESDDDDFSSDSFADENEDPDRPTKTTSVRRRPRISVDAKTFKYRPGESASESDSSDGRGGKRRRRRRSGKVTAHGAEGMAPVMEGKKRRKKGGKGKGPAAETNGAGDSGEDEVVVLGEHRAEQPYDDSYEVGMDCDPRPSPREEEDSFIVRFHPGAAQTPPSAASAARSAARQRTDGSTQPRTSAPSWNPFASAASVLLALLRAILVAVIFLFNTLASAFAWLAQAPVQAAHRLRRSLGLADWRKIGKPLGATAAVLLLASVLGRRSSDRSPLEDSPSSWRARLPSLGSGRTRSPLSSPSLPPDSVEGLLDRLAKIEGMLGAVSSQGRRSSRNVEALTARLGGMERRLDISDRSMTSLDGRVGSLRTEFSSLQERVKEAERVAKQALEASKVAQAAADAIEEHLPARLAVKVNPRSKALEIDPAFWQAMKDVFVGRQDLPASISGEVFKQQATLRASSQPSPSAIAAPVPPLSWQDFLAANEEALAAWSDRQLARQSQSGAVVSRPDFLQILRSELETAKVELDERAQESVQHKGDEVLRRSLAESSSYVDQVVKDAVAKIPAPKPAPPPPAVRVDTPAGDDVTGLLSAMIDAALLKFSKDTLAMTDFALYSAGGRVIPSITSDTFEQPIPRWGGLLKPKVILGRPPATALVPDVNVGNCWPFAGAKGQLGIKLARRVHVSDITIEHAAREVSFDMAAAPRDIEVWGLVEGQANFDKVAEYQAARADEPQTSSLPPSPGYILLGSLSYDIDSPRHVQTFTVPPDIQDLGVDVGIVVVRIDSNYGEDYTCLYRVRVHGEAAPDPVYEPST